MDVAVLWLSMQVMGLDPNSMAREEQTLSHYTMGSIAIHIRTNCKAQRSSI